MDGGCEKHYLKSDVSQGTHVAYLHHSDDPEVERPLARIALKPFHSTSRGYTKPILRPESRTYGDADSSFDKTVRNWSETNFPVKEGHSYRKNPMVYHDGGRYAIGDTKTLLSHPDYEVRSAAFHPENTSITPDDINKGLDDKDYNVSIQAIKHPNVTTENLEKAANHKSHLVAAAAFSHPNAQHSVLEKGMSHPVNFVRWHASSNENLPAHLIDKSFEDSDPDITAAAITHSKHVTSNHLEKALSSPHHDIAIAAASRGLPKHLISSAMEHPHHMVRKFALSLGDITPKHIDEALDTDNAPHAMRNKNASFDNIAKGLRHGNSKVIEAVINHPNLTDKHVDDLVSDAHDNSEGLRRLLRSDSNRIKSHHITSILSNSKIKNPNVKIEALQHPSAKSEHFKQAMNDSNEDVRDHAYFSHDIEKI